MLGAALLLPSYESMLAGLAALVVIAAVVTGFLLRPRKEIFYLSAFGMIHAPTPKKFSTAFRSVVLL